MASNNNNNSNQSKSIAPSDQISSSGKKLNKKGRSNNHPNTKTIDSQTVKPKTLNTDIENEFLADHLRSHNPKQTNPSSSVNKNSTQIFDTATSRSAQNSGTSKNSKLSSFSLATNSPHPSQSLTKRRSKLSSICSSSDITCICCLHELQTYVYYSCMHAVCLNCAVKMRVICQKTDCPICRKESSQVFCTKQPLSPVELASGLQNFIARSSNSIKSISNFKPLPSCSVGEMNRDDYLKIKSSGLYFNDTAINEDYHEVLQSACNICDQLFESFDDLEIHAKRAHKK